jgi:site-specific DNA recombinase
VRSIVAQWNAAGLTSAQRGAALTHQSVVTILRNPRIAGLSAYKGEIVSRGRWPELVSEETWRAVRALLDDPHRGRRTRGVRPLLGGLARCACERKACSSINSRGQHIYRCDRLRAPGGTGHVARLSTPVDDYVTAVVIERLSRPDAVDLLIDHHRPDVDALRSQAQVLRARLEEIAREFADDATMPVAMVRTMTERIQVKLADIEAQMADAGKVSVLGGLIGADDVRPVWDGLDIDRRRAVIDALMIITLHSPGRGARVFDPATVLITPKGQKT